MPELKKTLAEIARLEEKYGLCGVDILAAPGTKVCTDEAADFVLRFINRSVYLVSIKDTLPAPEPNYRNN